MLEKFHSFLINSFSEPFNLYPPHAISHHRPVKFCCSPEAINFPVLASGLEVNGQQWDESSAKTQRNSLKSLSVNKNNTNNPISSSKLICFIINGVTVRSLNSHTKLGFPMVQAKGRLTVDSTQASYRIYPLLNWDIMGISQKFGRYAGNMFDTLTATLCLKLCKLNLSDIDCVCMHDVMLSGEGVYLGWSDRERSQGEEESSGDWASRAQFHRFGA